MAHQAGSTNGFSGDERAVIASAYQVALVILDAPGTPYESIPAPERHDRAQMAILELARHGIFEAQRLRSAALCAVDKVVRPDDPPGAGH